ncbi:MAG: hypothetical protein MJZ07_06220 [Bacteroidales bacterium]|nr:hypothetical protein [Bacteroidales bacterium]
MRKSILSILATVAIVLLGFCSCSHSENTARIVPSDVPDSVYVGDQIMHVQGLAVDRPNKCMYFSFTSQFYKTDLEGNIIASIDRVQGHLGAMTLGPDGRVYASLECKDDEIGAGIANKLNIENLNRSEVVFYIAIIDVKKLDRMHMDPETDDVMTTVCIREAVNDYQASVVCQGDTLDHRYACSGIDGVTFGPAFGHKDGKKIRKNYLYVAYGVYGDTLRNDNNYNVLLRYDTKDWKKYETKVVFGEMHTNGPEQPDEKYFVYTGNTTWGVQNMAYDSFTNNIFLFVYKGKKSAYPNYDMFAVDCSVKPSMAQLEGVVYDQTEKPVLTLDKTGLYDEATDTYGWRFKYGSTGVCSLGNGYWVISKNAKDKETKLQSCNARLYEWTGDPEQPFKRILR